MDINVNRTDLCPPPKKKRKEMHEYDPSSEEQ